LDGGLYKREVEVKVNNNESKLVTLWGTKETLNKAETNSVLITFDRNKFRSERPFAILASVDKSNIRRRLGLIEFFRESEVEKLQGAEEKLLVIRMIQYQQVAQIQIPPK